MASSKACASYMEEMLTCAFCLELVKEPQTLMQCFHSYCKPCTHQLSQKQNNSPPGVTCPLCSNFSPNGEIRNNHFVNDLLGLYSKLQDQSKTRLKFCELCPTEKTSDASWRCLDCRENLCDECKSFHSRVRLFRGHRLLEISEETELVIDKLVFCNIHEDETLKLYCNECRDVICIMCQVVQHKLHETVTVQQALDNVLPDVNQNLVELGLKLEHINKAINHTEDERKKAEKAYDKCADEFDQKIEERIKQIRNAQKQVKEQMKKERELQMKHFEDAKTELLNVYKQLSNLQKVTTTSVERARHVTLLQELLQGGLLERLNTVNSEENTTKQLQVKLPTLEMNELEWGELVKMGLCGQVRFNDTTLKLDSISVNGAARNAEVRYWNGDFTEVFGKSLKQTLKIELPAFCQKMTVHGDKLFAPIRDRMVIHVYNKQGKLQDTIAVDGKPVCIEKSPVGDMLVCCCDTGLFVLKEDSKKLVSISRGEYSDMCMYRNKVYTWDYVNKQIVGFVRENREWKKQERVVNVTGQGNEYDTLQVRQCEGVNTGIEFFVCLYLQHTVLRVSDEGEQISQCGDTSPGGGTLKYPRVCGVDNDGLILIADGGNCKYKVVNTNTGTWTTVFTCDYNAYDAKVTNDNTVWLSRFIKGEYIITRHELSK